MPAAAPARQARRAGASGSRGHRSPGSGASGLSRIDGVEDDLAIQRAVSRDSVAPDAVVTATRLVLRGGVRPCSATAAVVGREARAGRSGLVVPADVALGARHERVEIERRPGPAGGRAGDVRGHEALETVGDDGLDDPGPGGRRGVGILPEAPGQGHGDQPGPMMLRALEMKHATERDPHDPRRASGVRGVRRDVIEDSAEPVETGGEPRPARVLGPRRTVSGRGDRRNGRGRS